MGAAHGAGDSPPVPGGPQAGTRHGLPRTNPAVLADGHATARGHRGPCPTRALGGELVSRGVECHLDLLGTVPALTSRGRGNWRPQGLCSAVAPLVRQPLPSRHQLSPARGRVTAAGRGVGDGQLRSQESRPGGVGVLKHPRRQPRPSLTPASAPPQDPQSPSREGFPQLPRV